MKIDIRYKENSYWDEIREKDIHENFIECYTISQDDLLIFEHPSNYIGKPIIKKGILTHIDIYKKITTINIISENEN